MPKWLAPWLIPVAMLLGVIVALALKSAGLNGTTIIWVLFALVVAGVLIHLRLRYLKQHPPDPELTHKPFWRL